MKQPVIIIGMGEMGGVFARAFLKAGHPVYPVLRNDNPIQIARELPDPAVVLLAVAEKDFESSLQQLPGAWRSRVAMLQNELLPGDWQAHPLDQPTVISVWFEKKPGMDFKVLVPSPAHGPRAQLIADALATLGIPVATIESEQDMLFELVRKNLYIVTTNICGLETGGTVSELWQNNAVLMNRVFDDALDIQQALTGHSFDRNHIFNAVLTAFDGDPDHKCMGRSAPQRLQRALQQADQAGLEVTELRRIEAAQQQ